MSSLCSVFYFFFLTLKWQRFELSHFYLLEVLISNGFITGFHLIANPEIEVEAVTVKITFQMIHSQGFLILNTDRILV